MGHEPNGGVTVDLILPVLNEAEAIPYVLSGVPNGFRPIVVDNDSNDDSAAIAAALGAKVVIETLRGFGAACARGLAESRADVVCFMDCDGSLDPADLPRVLSPIASRGAELSLGARRPVRGAWPLHARAANRILALEMSRRSGFRLRDVGPMRAARREDLLALGLEDRRFGWPLEMVVKAIQRGWRVTEVPVAYRTRIGGRSKVTGSVRGTARAVFDMARQL